MALTDQLHAYWKTDESSGNASDSAGGGYTLTNTNTVSYGTGIINNGADTGSANTNKRLTSTGSGGTTIGINDSAQSCTFNWWVNVNTVPASNTAGFMWEFAVSTGATNTGYLAVQYYNNAGTPQLYIARNCNATLDQAGSNQTLTTGTWYMLTYTYDGSTQYLYVNGSSTPLVTKASSTRGTGTSYIDLFTWYANFDSTPTYGNFLSAKMDEFGIWTRVLSGSEITQLYNGGAGNQYPFSGAAANTGFFNMM